MLVNVQAVLLREGRARLIPVPGRLPVLPPANPTRLYVGRGYSESVMAADDEQDRRSGRKPSSSEQERAERIVEDLSRRTARFVTAAVARVREEAEDIWAEAQSIRHGERA